MPLTHLLGLCHHIGHIAFTSDVCRISCSCASEMRPAQVTHYLLKTPSGLFLHFFKADTSKTSRFFWLQHTKAGMPDADVTVAAVRAHFRSRLATLLVELDHLRMQDAWHFQSFILECTKPLTDPSCICGIDPHGERQGGSTNLLHEPLTSSHSVRLSHCKDRKLLIRIAPPPRR